MNIILNPVCWLDGQDVHRFKYDLDLNRTTIRVLPSSYN